MRYPDFRKQAILRHFPEVLAENQKTNPWIDEMLDRFPRSQVSTVFPEDLVEVLEVGSENHEIQKRWKQNTWYVSVKM